MIKYEAENGNVEILDARGSVADITTDVAHMIHLVYEGLKEQNETEAEKFRKGICILVDNMVFGDKEEKKEADTFAEINKQLDDILEKLKRMGAE